MIGIRKMAAAAGENSGFVIFPDFLFTFSEKKENP